jgi:hypothetical protein
MELKECVNPNPPEPTIDVLDVRVGLGELPQQIPLSYTPAPGLVKRTTASPTLPLPNTVSNSNEGAEGSGL